MRQEIDNKLLIAALERELKSHKKTSKRIGTAINKYFSEKQTDEYLNRVEP